MDAGVRKNRFGRAAHLNTTSRRTDLILRTCAVFALSLLVPRTSIAASTLRLGEIGEAELRVVSRDEYYGPCRVTRLVDGDTVDVRCGDQLARVRLLNIDTPERSVPFAYR